MKKCISEGVAKVNVNKLVLDDYSDFLKENVGKVPQTKLMEQGVEMVVRQTWNGWRSADRRVEQKEVLG
jgi:fructose-bisphosphate aldolase class II